MSSTSDSEFAKLRRRFEKVAQRDLSGHKKRVLCVGWNCTGEKIASGSFDNTLRIYPNADRRHAKESTEFTGHTDSVFSLCWHPSDADLLSTTSSDKTCKFWDVRSPKWKSSIDIKGDGSNLAWSPDGQTLLCGGRLPGNIDFVAVIDARMNKTSKVLKFANAVNQIAWTKEGDKFLITTGSGEIEMRGFKKPYEELKLIKSVHSNSGAVFSINVSPDGTPYRLLSDIDSLLIFLMIGTHFATGSGDALVNVWDTAELVTVRTIDAMASLVRCVGISYDGQLVASCGQEDNFIDISHVGSAETVVTIKTESAGYHLAWHPKRHLLAFCVDEKGATSASNPAVNVKIWGVESTR